MTRMQLRGSLPYTGHKYMYTSTDVKVFVKEDRNLERKMKEAIAIHKKKQVQNRDRGHKVPPMLLQLSVLLSCHSSGHVT